MLIKTIAYYSGRKLNIENRCILQLIGMHINHGLYMLISCELRDRMPEINYLSGTSLCPSHKLQMK